MEQEQHSPKYNHALLMVHPLKLTRTEEAWIGGFEATLQKPFEKVARDYSGLILMDGTKVQYSSPWCRGTRTLKAESFVKLEEWEYWRRGYIDSPRGFIQSNDTEVSGYYGDIEGMVENFFDNGSVSVGGAVFGLCHRVACVGNDVRVHRYYPGYGLLDFFRGSDSRNSSYSLWRLEQRTVLETAERWSAFKLNIPAHLVYVDAPEGKIKIGRGIMGEKQFDWTNQIILENEYYEQHNIPPAAHLMSEAIAEFSMQELAGLFAWYLPPHVALGDNRRMAFSVDDHVVQEFGEGKRVFILNLQK